MSSTTLDGVAAFGEDRIELGYQSVIDGGTAVSDGSVTLNTQAGSDGIVAGGAVSLGYQAVVEGDVVAQGAFTDNNSTVSGSVSSAGQTPAPVDPVLPGAASVDFDGLNDVYGNYGESFTLAAGSYGDVRVGGQGTLTLTAGTYHFERFDGDYASNVVFDVTDGDIQVFVAQQTQIGGDSSAVVTGGDAGDVYFESQGGFRLGYGSDWVGTVYTPDADITADGNNDIDGALYSGGALVMQGGSTLDYVASDYLAGTSDSAPPVADTTAPEAALSVTSGGDVSLSASDNAEVSEVVLTLRDSADNVLASSANLNPQLSAGGSLGLTQAQLEVELGIAIPAGTYTLGLAVTDLAGNLAVAESVYVLEEQNAPADPVDSLAAGEIAGYIYVDGDNDGERSEAEGGLAGWMVFLDRNGNGLPDADEFGPGEAARTDASGAFRLRNIPAGSGQIGVFPQSGLGDPTVTAYTLTEGGSLVLDIPVFDNAVADAAALLGEYNLIVLNDLDGTQSQDVEGSTLVGGDAAVSTPNFATNRVTAADGTALVVAGDITASGLNFNRGGIWVGGNFQVANALGVNSDGAVTVGGEFATSNLNGRGDVTVGGGFTGQLNNNGQGNLINIGGQVSGGININNGTLTENTGVMPAVPEVGRVDAALRALSADLAARIMNGTVTVPSGQPGPLTLDASGVAAGELAVFTVSGTDLLENGLVQRIDLIEGDAAGFIINITGQSVTQNAGVHLGSAFQTGADQPGSIASRTLFNFVDATSVRLETQWFGSVLATNATLENRNEILGTVVVQDMTLRGKVRLPGSDLPLGQVTPAANAVVSGPDTTNEGATYTVDLSVFNAVATGWTIDWGDGTTTNLGGDATTASHTYDDGAEAYSISAIATTAGGSLLAVPLEVSVLNVAPTLVISGDSTAQAGSEYVLNLSSSDPGQDTITGWVIDYGDGPAIAVSGDPAQAPPYVYSEGGTYTITATATDEDGTFSSNSLTVVVADAPAAAITGPASVTEGEAVSFDLSPTNAITSGWTVDFGDGSSVVIDGSATSVSHVYADGDNNYVVTAVATTASGDLTATQAIAVGNVAPVLTIGGAESVGINETYVLSLASVDPGEDTITQWVIDWGDGSSPEVVVGNPESVTHTFTTEGTLDVSATATDEDGTFSSNTLSVLVEGVIPVAITGAPVTPEGSFYQLDLDGNEAAATEWQIDWGDGSPLETFTGSSGTIAHVYADGPNDYTVTAIAQTPRGASIAAPLSIQVDNVAPTLTLSGAGTVEAGAVYSLGLSSVDPGEDTIAQWVIDFGDGTTPQVVNRNPLDAEHVFASDGTYTVTATATDEDGTYSSNSLVVEVTAVVPVGVTLVEDQDLVTTNASDNGGVSVSFTVPDNPGAIQIDFSGLAFDSQGDNPGDINDAFELIVRSADGSAVVPAIAGAGFEAQFNLTQGRSALLADGVVFNPLGSDSGSVLIDISTLAVGTELELLARLLNNDADDTSTVTVDFKIDAQQGLYASTVGKLGTSLQAAASDDSQVGIDYSLLADVTSVFDVDYASTGYNEQAGQLQVAVDLLKAGRGGVREDLLLAVRGLRAQDVADNTAAQLTGFDGLLSRTVAGVRAGTPYVRLSSLLEKDVNGFFIQGGAVENLLLTFEGVTPGERFDYDLVILGQANAAPAFTSDPYAIERGGAYPVNLINDNGGVTQVLELVANSNSNTLRYAPRTSDPEADAVTVSVLTGPEGLTLVNGELNWTPGQTDLGSHTVTLRATDEFGAFDPASDQVLVVRVLDNVANRPPRFTTDPVTSAEVGRPYVYDAAAFDPDGNDLLFTGVASYTDRYGNTVNLDGGSVDTDGFTVNPVTGEVIWTPDEGALGQTVRIDLTVSDQQAPALTDTQSYDVQVAEDATNRDPVIVSTPVINFATAYEPGTATDNANPQVIDLRLGAGQQVIEEVTFAVPEQGINATADIVFIVDESGSMAGAQAWLREMIVQLDTQLADRGITDNRFGLVGFLAEPRDVGVDQRYEFKLYDPTGELEFSQTLALGDPLPDVELEMTGQYSVVVTSVDGSTIESEFIFQIEDGRSADIPDLPAGTPLVSDLSVLSLGDTVVATIDDTLEVDLYDFTVTQATPVLIDALSNVRINWELRDGERVIYSDRALSSDLALLTLESGTYTLSVKGAETTNGTGSYAFRLLDVGVSSTLLLNTETTLSLSNDTAAYRFTAESGDELVFDSVEATDVSGSWRIYGPDGRQVSTSSLAASRSGIELTDSGEYVLLLEGAASDTQADDLTFRLDVAGGTTTLASLDTLISGTIGLISQQDTYEFTLTEPTTVLFDSLTNTSGLQWRLRDGNVDLRTYTGLSGDNARYELGAGTYTLTVRGTSSSTGTGGYAFRLLDLAAAPELVLNTETTVGLSNDTAVYRFTGESGDELLFDSIDATGVSGSWRIYGPDGIQVSSSNLAADRVVALTRSGEYVLTLEGSNSDSVVDDYTFRVNRAVENTASALLGDTVTGVIAAASQRDRYEFTLTESTAVVFDSLTNSSGLQWSLADQGGRVLQTLRGLSSENFRYELGAGAYTLTVQGSASATGTGSYAFRLLDTSVAPELVLNTETAVSLSNDTAVYRFTADSGDELIFDSVEATDVSGSWRIYGPDGRQVSTSSLSATRSGIVLTRSGEYLLTIEGTTSDTQVDDLTFRLDVARGTTTVTALNALVSGAIGLISQQDSYEFTLTEPTTVLFDSLTNNSGLQWRLRDGNVDLRAYTGLNSDNARYELGAGTYTLTVRGTASSTGTGSYAFRLLDLGVAPELVLDTETTLSLSNDVASYRFTAESGDELVFDSIEATGVSGTWRIYGPDGNQVSSSNLATDRVVALTRSGEYVLTLEGSNSDSVADDYTFKVNRIAENAATLNLDDLVSGTIAAVTQQDTYTFTVTQPTAVIFDSLTNNSLLQWRLADGETDVRGFTGFGSDNFRFDLGPGSYTLTVRGSAAATGTGSYAFRLIDAGQSALLTLDSDTVTSISNDTQAYRFVGRSGDIISFNSVEATDVLGSWRLYSPQGTVVSGGSGNLTTSRENLTLSRSGEYVLVLEGRQDDTQVDDFTFRIDQVFAAPQVTAGQLITLDQVVSDVFAPTTTQALYRFEVTSATGFHFDIRGGANNLNFTIFDGPTPVFSSQQFNIQSRLGPGTYTLRVDPSSPGSVTEDVDYAFRIVDLSAAPVLSLNTETTASLANDSVVYRFTGTSGDELVFDSLDATGVAGNWLLYNADTDGSPISSGSLTADRAAINLTRSGVYALVLEGQSNDTQVDDLTFRLDRAGGSTQALVLDALNNGTINLASQQDSYEFVLTEPTAVLFDSQISTSSLQWRLRDGDTNIRTYAGLNSDNQRYELDAGTYELTISGTASTTPGQGYAFRLIDLNASAEITLDSPTTVSLADDTIAYRFSATSGDELVFDSLDATAVSGNWRIYGPEGTQVASASLSADRSAISLTRTGEYVLTLEGSANDTVSDDYTFSLNRVTRSVTPANLDALVSGTITAVDQEDTYEFTLTQPRAVIFDSLTSSSGLQWRLQDGTTDVRGFTRFDSDNFRYELGVGTYTVTVRGTTSTNGTGDYAFRLLDLGSVPTLTLGTDTTVSLSNDTTAYRFLATTGEELAFTRVDATGVGGSWRLYAPDGTAFSNGSGSLGSNRSGITAPQSGEYVLVLEGQISDTAADDLTFRLDRAGVTTTAADLNTLVQGTIASSSQQDQYEFTLDRTTTVQFDSLTNSSGLQWQLQDGDTVISSSFRGLSSDNFRYELGAGTYTLVIRGTASANGTGSYTFQLIDQDAATELTLGSTEVVSLANQTAAYRFLANQGDELFFDSLDATDVSGSWRIYSPDGSQITAASLATDRSPISLTRTGQYVLVLEGQQADIAANDYTFSLSRVAENTAALALDTSITGTIATAGQYDRYTFTLNKTTDVLFDTLTNTSGLQWQLTDGGQRVSGSFRALSDDNLQYELGAGTYTLTVRAGTGTNNTGDYEVRLLNLTDAPVLNPGESTSLVLRNGSAAYRVTADNGDFLKIDVGGSDNQGGLLLQDAAGARIDQLNFGSSEVSTQLQINRSGTHYLILQGLNFSNATEPLVVSLSTPDERAGTLVQGIETVDSFTTAFERVTYSVDLTQGDLVYLDGLRSPGTTDRFRLLDPNGRVVHDSDLLLSEDTAAPLVARVSGTYTVEAINLSGLIGEFAFRVWDINDDAQVLQGRPADRDPFSLVSNGATTFTFNGSVGEQIDWRVSADDLLWTDANEAATRAQLLRTSGATEDGFNAIVSTFSDRDFREDAIVNFVLLTDEPNNGPSGITRDDVLSLFEATGAVFTSVVGAQYVSDNGIASQVLGIDSTGRAFLPDGTGGVTVDTGGAVLGSGGQVFDYVEPALLTGGSAWNVNDLRGVSLNSPVIQSFTSAFVTTFADTVQQQVDLNVIASDPSVLVNNITGIQNGVFDGSDISFDIEFTGDAIPQSFELLLVRADDPGVVLGVLPVRINDGYFYDVDAVDPDGDTVTYALIGETYGATIDAGSGFLNFQAPANGQYTFTVEARDGRGGRDEQTWTIAVTDVNTGNQGPQITSDAPDSAEIGRALAFTVEANDPDGDALQYQLLDAPAGASIDRVTGEFTWTPAAGQQGEQTFTVRVIDGRGGSDTRAVTITVSEIQAPNAAPFFTERFPTQVILGNDLRFRPEALDPNNDPLTYALQAGPDGAFFDAESGILIWEPKADQLGSHDFIFAVNDGRGGQDTEAFTVNVVMRNENPEITSVAPTAAKSGVEYVYQLEANDPNGDALTYEVDRLSAERGVAIDANGRLTWTPGAAGVATIGVRVSDGRGGEDTQVFDLDVVEPVVNTPPTFTSTVEGFVFLNEAFSVKVTAEDIEDGVSTAIGTGLGFSLDEASLVRGVSIVDDPTSVNHGLLRWTPRSVGTFTTTVTVTDSQGASARQVLTFPVNVRPVVNEPPVFTSTPTGPAVNGRSWTYNVTASDPDLDDVTLTLIEAPAWLDQAVGTIGTPGALTLSGSPDAGGTYRFVVRADDGQGNSIDQVFDLPVIANAPPVIVEAPLQRGAEAGDPADYTVIAFDPNGDPLTFELVSGNGTGSFGAVTDGDEPGTRQSTLTFTPAPGTDGTQELVVRVSDGTDSIDHIITLEVIDPAQLPPVASLSVPGFVLLGDTFNAQVEASDPNDDVLTYAFVDERGNTFTQFTPAATPGSGNGTNAPVGLSIDPTTGVLSWTPVEGQQLAAGSDPYAFTVRVSDSRFAVDLGPAQVQVIEPPVAISNPPQFVRAVASATSSLEAGTGASPTLDLEFDFIDFDTGNAVEIGFAVLEGGGTGSFDGFNIPSSASTDPANPSRAILSFTPTGAGQTVIRVTLTDNDGLMSSRDVVIDVVDPGAVNRPPVASLTARTATAVNELFVAQVEASDPNGDDLTYSLSFPDPARAPLGLTIDTDTGRLSWTPGSDDVTPTDGQPYLYTVTISDGTETVEIGPVELIVVSRFTNAGPVFVTDPTGIRASGSDALVYEAEAEDPDGDPLVYTLDSGPAGASIDRETGRFVWRPAPGISADQTFQAQITATDPYGASATQVIELRFTAGNAAPRITSTPPQPGFGGEDYIYLVEANDADGDAITFSLTGETSGLSITQLSATTARVVWADPAAADTRAFEIVATDARGLTGRQAVSLTIGTPGSGEPGDPGDPGGPGTGAPTGGTVDLPPVITSTPVFAVVAGQDYRYRVIAEDPDGAVTYGLEDGTPAWLNIDPNTGMLSGTAPGDADGQTPRITVTATQAGFTALQGYTLQITSNAVDADNNPVNNAPVIEPADGLVAFAGSEFLFNVVARDAEGDALSFALVDNEGNEYTALDGIRIDNNGRVSWDVPVGFVPGLVTFSVLARDSQGAVSAVENFTIDVKPSGTDEAPTVGLRASTTRIDVGQAVIFAVDARDDVSLAEVFVTLDAPFLSGGPIRLDIDGRGLARYTPPAGTEGQAFTVTATAIDTSGNVSVTSGLQIDVVAPDTAGPVIRITNLAAGAVIDSATTLRGAIFDPDVLPNDGGNLVYYLVSAVSEDGQRTVLAEDGVFNGTADDVITGLGDDSIDTDLGVLSPLRLADGVYTVEFLAQDADGRTVSTRVPVTIESSNEVKLGNFRQTFIDMNVPVAGVPLTVERTYDSVDADVAGDFGFGWSLDILSGRAQVSNLAADDLITGDNFLGATFNTPWQYGTRIELDLPGGEKLGFTAVPMTYQTGGGVGGRIAGSLLGNSAGLFAIGFLPDFDSLGNKLELLGGQRVRLEDDLADRAGLTRGQSITTVPVFQNADGALTTADRLPFNPVTVGWDYRLTTRDGREFVFDSRTGDLERFQDAYGNRVVLSDTEITSFQRGSSDPTGGLTITRDAANGNRITRIENALGFGVNYRYDSFGDLVGVDREVFLDNPATTDVDEYEVVTTSYGYQTPEAAADPSDPTLRDHFLDEIRDHDGVSLASNEYDENGRLKRVSNDVGTDVTVTYDDVNRTQTTVDAFGVTTITTYDERGNVERIEQPTSLYGGEPVVYLFTHDENNNLLSQTDPLGRVTTYTYDDRNRLAKVTSPFAPGEDPADFTTTYTYDDRTDQIATITSPDGRVERREYNAFGDLTRLSDETGYIFQEWDYDEAGRLTREGSPDEGYFLYRYDPVTGQLAETEDPDGNVITSQFDAIGQLTGFVDEDGLNQLFYDGLGREVRADYGDTSIDYTYDGDSPEWSRIESPSIGTVERLLSPAGQLEGWNLANGGEVRYVYDRGRLDQEIDAVGRVTQYRYDELGRVSRVEDLSTGNFVEYTYDIAGQVIRTVDALGNEVTTDIDLTDTGRQVTTNARGFSVVSDVDGLITTITEGVTLDPADGSVVNTAATRTTTVERDPAGLPIRFVNADGTSVSVQYRNRDVLDDAEQSPTRITDEAGRSRVFTYLDDGRLQTASDLAGNQITLTYDESEIGDGRLDTITGPTGETVTYGYDADGRVNSITRRGLGTQTVNAFNAAGDPESITLATGETVTLAYDADTGRLTSRTTDTGETASYVYGLNDELRSLTDNTGETVYAYYSPTDPQETTPGGASHAGRLKSITQPNGTSITYTYDIAGRVATVTTQASAADTPRTTTYTYDANGNIETVTDPFGGETTYTYDERDRLQTRTLPNGVISTWTFDDRDRLLSLVHVDGSGGVIASFTYTHETNATGEPSRITREDGSYVELDYDAANRLTEERYHDAVSTLNETITYEYDAAGNRTRVVTNGQAAVYSASVESDFLLSTIDAPGSDDDQSFTYSPGGVLESITRNGETWTFTYNSAGQITAATNASGRTLTYTYDGENERVGVTDSATGTLNYLVAPPAQNLGVSIGHRYLESDASGGLVNGWVYAGENPILRYDAAGNLSYYLEDASDSIAALTDDSGTITSQYAYDGFGNLLTGSDAVEDFGYHAALHDEATGLIDFRLRTYDPVTGRFTSVDPVAPLPTEVESYNPYMFSNNNPHLYSDPTGGFSLTEINVTQGIQGAQQILKTAGVQFARNQAREALQQFVFQQLQNALIGFLPFGNVGRGPVGLTGGLVLEAVNEGISFGRQIENALCGLVRGTGFEESIHIEPSIERDGTPRRNGISCSSRNDPSVPRPGGNIPRPDFIFKSGLPTTRNETGRAYGPLEVKRSVTTLYNSYVKAGATQSNQYAAITNYANRFGFRIAGFITLFGGGQNERLVEAFLTRESAQRGSVFLLATIF
ncbi:MAG: putative Ig domain-containing protein [Planctomycetota bacterium]